MGYYTEYTLEMDAAGDEISIKEILVELTGYTSWEEHGVGLYTLGCAKWYDHRDHMARLSKQHPNVLFTLNGEGEESGDLWREYFKNGKSHRIRAKISFDPYNENLLT